MFVLCRFFSLFTPWTSCSSSSYCRFQLRVAGPPHHHPHPSFPTHTTSLRQSDKTCIQRPWEFKHICAFSFARTVKHTVCRQRSPRCNINKQLTPRARSPCLDFNTRSINALSYINIERPFFAIWAEAAEWLRTDCEAVALAVCLWRTLNALHWRW